MSNLFKVPDVISSVISTRTLFLSVGRTNSHESKRRNMYGWLSVFKMATSSLNRDCSSLLNLCSCREEREREGGERGGGEGGRYYIM